MKHRSKNLLTIRISHIPIEVREEILIQLQGKETPSDKEIYEGDLRSILRNQPELRKYFPQFNIR